MDLIDTKLLCELDLNCRESYSVIAKKLRVSRNVVDYRIKKLEEEGIITKYICSLNLGKLGYKTYKIYLKINPTIDSEQMLKQDLKRSSCVIHCLKMEGAFDYSLSIAVQNVKELNDFLMNLKNKEVIKDYAVSIVVYSKIFKLHKLLLGQTKELTKIEKYSVEEKIINIDEKDMKILKLITQNANLPIINIAQKSGLSVDVVKYHLKQLKQELITSFRITFDINKLGYHHYLILLRIKQATKEEEDKLVSWCGFKDIVMYCTKRIGEFDFEINVAIKDIDSLKEFLSELKQEFKEIIDTYETMISTELVKLNYLPIE